MLWNSSDNWLGISLGVKKTFHTPDSSSVNRPSPGQFLLPEQNGLHRVNAVVLGVELRVSD